MGYVAAMELNVDNASANQPNECITSRSGEFKYIHIYPAYHYKAFTSSGGVFIKIAHKCKELYEHRQYNHFLYCDNDLARVMLS